MYKQKKDWVLWVAVILISAAIIYFGGQKATDGLKVFVTRDNATIEAEVVSVGEVSSSEESLGGSKEFKTEELEFKSKLLDGYDKGKEVSAVQKNSDIYAGSDKIKKVEVGDKVLLLEAKALDGSDQWQFIDYYRFDKIIILGAIFGLLLVVLGKFKGLNTIISLVYTFLFVFLVFVPWVMNGYNAYIGVCITVLFTVVMTLLLICGWGKKSFVTMAGCISGVAVAALITDIMNQFMHLTGFIDEHSMYLAMLNPERPIDLVSIVFAAIIIGALGAIMDVAMDISSALYELCNHVPNISFKKLFTSGMSIGSDIMGTMANTLILAYIGSSLCSIILLFTYSASLTHLVNREVIIIEFLQALTGSLAVLLTVPFTVVIACLVYRRGNSHE